MALATAAADAAQIVGVTPLEGIEYVDGSAFGTLSLDVFFSETASAASFVVALSPAEVVLGDLIFSAYAYNETGQNAVRLDLDLQGGARFLTVGTARDFVFEIAEVQSTPTTARVLPLVPVADGELLELGNLQTEVEGAVDWEIDTSALESGNQFTLRVEMLPEPGGAATAALLALLGLAKTSRRSRR